MIQRIGAGMNIDREREQLKLLALPAYGDCEGCGYPVFPTQANVRYPKLDPAEEHVWHTGCYNDAA